MQLETTRAPATTPRAASSSPRVDRDARPTFRERSVGYRRDHRSRTEPNRTGPKVTRRRLALHFLTRAFRSFVRSSQTPDRRTSDDTERVNASKHVRRSRVVFVFDPHRIDARVRIHYSFNHAFDAATDTHARTVSRVGLNDGIGTIYTRRTDRRVIPIAIHPSSPRVDSRVRRTTMTATTRLTTSTRSRRLRRARTTPKAKRTFRVTTKRRREDDTKRRGES